ncbi:hypothetical protein [Wukongibacter sp. M2B1]|uniref:hypothetical protein n=1 Tax=Wukongibacter sp. M2B1 TaxID=3088895 RepID=UPI003D795EF3
MWKKIGLTISILFVIMSIGVCVYLYNQDYLILWKYSINKEIEMENCIVKVEEINLYNFDKKSSFVKKQFELYGFIGKLPEFMRMPFMKAYMALNSPYEVDNELLKIKLSGKIISNDVVDSISTLENLEIDIIDEVGVNYSKGKTWTHDSSSKIVPFEITGEYFNVDRKDNTMTIVITDKKKNDIHKFEINPQYVKETYNHFYSKSGL